MSTRIHLLCPRKFTQTMSTKIRLKGVHENSPFVSTEIHPKCPRKFPFFVHESSATQRWHLEKYPLSSFSSNVHLILNSIWWIGGLNFANILKWHTLLQLKKLNNVFSWYFNPHKKSFFCQFLSTLTLENHLFTYSWHWLTFHQVLTFLFLST